MRRAHVLGPLLALGLAAVAACAIMPPDYPVDPAGGTGAGGSASTGPASVCDGMHNCNTCTTCAQFNSLCSTQNNACMSSACLTYSACLDPSHSPTCSPFPACCDDGADPTAFDTARELVTCVSCACLEDCPGACQ